MKTPKQDLVLTISGFNEVKMVKFASPSHEEFFQEQMKDPEFRKAFEASEEEFNVLRQIIEMRLEKGLSQSEIAKQMHTTRSVVCRLEAGLSNGVPPSLNMLKRYAAVLGKTVQLRLV